MTHRFDTISFLSDYGHADEYVGVVHSVIRAIAPSVHVLDITHTVSPFDVRAGGLALARSANYLVPGVVLAVVDPGVGTERRRVAIEVGDGQSYLIGPDNGLLAPAVALVGGATDAIVLDNDEYHLAAPSPTFDGRDVFGPVAAHLARGVPFQDLGTPIDSTRLMPGILPVSEEDDGGAIRAEVLWIDRFGNAQLNVDPEQLADWPATVSIAGGREERVGQRVPSFADVPTGAIGVLVDSYGLMALAIDQGSAAQELGLGPADEVTLTPVEGRTADLGTRAVPVALTHRPPGEEGP
jgi:S-adenosylmethionine hydrolase